MGKLTLTKQISDNLLSRSVQSGELGIDSILILTETLKYFPDGNDDMESLTSGLLDTFVFNKKSTILRFPCGMKFFPISAMKQFKNIQKYAKYCGKSFIQK